MTDRPLAIRAFAEALGTGLLLTAIVGSGIAAEQLSPDQVGMQLLENAVATALALVALIFTFGSVSGAHLNPAVTLSERLQGNLDTPTATVYIGSQIAGACVGTVAANVMYELSAIDWSGKDRASAPHALAEVIATFGLLIVIVGVVHSRRIAAVPVAVASYVGAAMWFTSSTCFANPAVTIARSLTDSFTGIAPSSVPVYLGAQLLAVGLGVGAGRVLFPRKLSPQPDLLPQQPSQG